MKYIELREQICDVCHKMWQLGWVAANDGNVSVKLPDGNFMATPTGISKSFITPEKLVIINSKGEVIEGEHGYKPSSEIKMHLRCYREREDVGAVVHAHPPTATGYAVAGKSLDRNCYCYRLYSANTIRNPEYRRGSRGYHAISSGARCFSASESRCADSGSRSHHCVLPHGNS